jgi:hypothetical protein
VIVERRSDVEREAELHDHENNADAVTSNSDDQPARGTWNSDAATKNELCSVSLNARART